jgi:hypothetical protein
MPARVHIYWDNSNIFIGSKFAAQKREAGFAQQNVRIQFVTVQAETGLREGRREGAGRSDGAGIPWSAATQACVT